SWPAIARANQLPPPGDWWQIWLLLAGRGFGKTRTLAEWVCQQAAFGQADRIALVAATAADARDVLVEGASGILAVAPPLWLPKIVSGLAQMQRWATLIAGMIDLLKLLGGLLVGLFRSNTAREAELAFLRQQLVVLQRSAPAR